MNRRVGTDGGPNKGTPSEKLCLAVNWKAWSQNHRPALAPVPYVEFLSFATNQIRSVVNFEKRLGSLALSPDGRWILFDQIDQEGTELMLVENFR